VSGRGSIDSLPPFVETGPYDYDAYVDAATGPDWTAAPPRGSAPLPGDRSGNERQGNERQGNERQGNERQGNERQGGGRQAAERQSVERQAAERQANERPGNERQGGERALAGDAGLAVGGSTGPRAAGSGDLVEELAAVGRRLDELARLRRHDVELVDRLHEENGKLRQGELTEAMGPLLRGLIRLHDQMSSLGGDDPQSVAGILRKQLLQVLDISADVRPTSRCRAARSTRPATSRCAGSAPTNRPATARSPAASGPVSSVAPRRSCARLRPRCTATVDEARRVDPAQDVPCRTGGLMRPKWGRWRPAG
jgi:hypothetical protein